MARSLNSDAIVVPARDPNVHAKLDQTTREYLKSRIVMLDNIGSSSMEMRSPCTECYNTKVTLLKLEAERQGATAIAFGHHATDAIASFLKAALMYIDRWDRGHLIWKRQNFSALIDESAVEFEAQSEAHPILDQIGSLAATDLAATDEPPMQSVGRRLRIVRPLFGVFEHEIKLLQNTNCSAPEPSGCGHGATKETETPREMIHYHLLNRLLMCSCGAEHLLQLHDLASSGIKEDGALKMNTRNMRSDLLGAQYRPEAGLKL